MTDLAQFLRDRYTERRAIAEAAAAASKARSGDWRYKAGDDRVYAVETFPESLPAQRELWTPLVTEAGSYVGDTLDDEIGWHIATNAPADVIADLDAKLAIVDEHAPGGHYWPGSLQQFCATCGSGEPNEYPTAWPCRTLRTLARPFAGHPDHKGEEWAP
ncbi:DUF6221 family protein [Streptomyces sp. NPDC005786]|uniref:DUF6221 family protein n=1 Tax=Streptomyces sp. NPDC005786 TaxID=3154891 RepID=UPI0033F1AF7E